MMEFVISNYIVFIVAAVVLLLGLIGYFVDKKKYNKYREELMKEQRALETLDSQPEIQSVVTPALVEQEEILELPNEKTLEDPTNETT